MKAEDGIAHIAMGLGKTVVEGERTRKEVSRTSISIDEADAPNIDDPRLAAAALLALASGSAWLLGRGAAAGGSRGMAAWRAAAAPTSDARAQL